VRAGDVAVAVDHLGFEPQAELHAKRVDGLHQRVESGGPHVRGDHPVAKPGGVVAARTEPPVVEHVPLDSDGCCPLGQVDEFVRVVAEVNGFPYIERYRPLSRDPRRAAAHMRVEASCDLVESGPVGGVDPGARVAVVAA
jgi:hypothetical protein